MNELLNNKNNRIKPDLVISEEYFSYFYHFRDSVLHGNKSRAKHSLDQIKEYVNVHFSEDISRLVFFGMAECFSPYLKNKEAVYVLKEVSVSAERALEKLNELIEFCLDKE